MHRRNASLSALLALACLHAHGQEPDAEKRGHEIMMKNYEQMTTRNFRSDVQMQLIARDGKIQTRHVKRISQTDERDQESYHVRFLDPPTVRDTLLLIVEHADREDDVWFYLPAIKKVKRVSGTNMRSSYMGTEFTFKDIKREKVPKKVCRYVLVGEEALDGVPHHVMDAFPATEQEKLEQGYHHRRLWVRTDTHLITRADIYDEDGDFIKRLVCSDMRSVGNSGKSRYFRFEMTSVKEVKTVLLFDLMRIDEEPVDASFFTMSQMMRR